MAAPLSVSENLYWWRKHVSWKVKGGNHRIEWPAASSDVYTSVTIVAVTIHCEHQVTEEFVMALNLWCYAGE